jgi:hypothetical protein
MSEIHNRSGRTPESLLGSGIRAPTAHVPAPRAAKIALLVGALVFAFSVFLSWVHLPRLGDLDLVELMPAARALQVPDARLLAWGTFALAGVAVTVACLTIRTVRLLHLLVGAAALVWVAHLMYVLDHLGRGPLGRAQPGAAPWVALAGAGVMFTSGLLPATDQPPAEHPEHTPGS